MCENMNLFEDFNDENCYDEIDYNEVVYDRKDDNNPFINLDNDGWDNSLTRSVEEAEAICTDCEESEVPNLGKVVELDPETLYTVYRGEEFLFKDLTAEEADEYAHNGEFVVIAQEATSYKTSGSTKMVSLFYKRRHLNKLMKKYSAYNYDKDEQDYLSKETRKELDYPRHSYNRRLFLNGKVLALKDLFHISDPKHKGKYGLTGEQENFCWNLVLQDLDIMDVIDFRIGKLYKGYSYEGILLCLFLIHMEQEYGLKPKGIHYMHSQCKKYNVKPSRVEMIKSNLVNVYHDYSESEHYYPAPRPKPGSLNRV